MALYRRIFPHRDKKGRWGFRSARAHKNDYNFISPEVLASQKSWQAPEFDLGQIRLLVFNECDAKGRKLLFDSRAIRRKDQKGQSPQGKGNPCVFGRRFCGNAGVKGQQDDARPRPATGAPPQTSPNGDGNNQYYFLRPSSDVKLLGEMMYGSVAMSYRGSTVKVHTIRSPPELMLSQVFLLKPRESQDPDNISLAPVELMIPQRSTSSTESIAHSLPVAVPPSSPYKSTDEDSGVVSGSGNNSFLTPFPSPGSSVSSVSSNQSNSFHRRWMRNQVTSLEHGVRRKSSLETITVEEPLNRRRHPKIGMGVVISLFQEAEPERRRHFQTFFFSHFTLFEGHFHRLGLAVEKALSAQRRTFILPIMDALDSFRSAVHTLYCAPRIQRPIWLNMMTYQMQRGHLCEHLVHEIAAALDAHNSKQTNFFFSRLLTAVLMHHLAWVPTVIPAESAPSRAYLDKHSSTLLDMLAKSHPYNPLWAQLGDIFGAIGYPVKVAKTIVVGRRADVVCRLLYILSYFIRCSEVHEISEQRERFGFEHLAPSQLPPAAEGATAGVLAEPETTETRRARRGAASSDSLDSGLESSEERPSVAGDKTDSPAGRPSAESRATRYGADGVTMLATADGKSPAENQTWSAMPPGVQTKPPSAMDNGKCPGEDARSELRGGDGLELNSKPLEGSVAAVARPERPSSGGLYPDLQSILSGSANRLPASGESSALTPCPSDPTSAAAPALSVQLRDAGELMPKTECAVAVGRAATTDSKDAIHFTSAIGPFARPKASTAEESVSDSEAERSPDAERRAGLGCERSSPQSPAELVESESWPGHDRSPEAVRGGRPGEGSPRATRGSGSPAPTGLYPTVDLSTGSVEATPVASTDSTDTESLDGTPPLPRRNKRFPLTSPLARAYQQSLRAKELDGQPASDAGTHNSVNAEEPTSPLKPQQGGDNDDDSSAHQPAATRPDGNSNGDDPRAETRRPGPLAPPTSLALQAGDPQADAASRGQQTTPTGQGRRYRRCFSASSSASSGYSDSTLMDHEELPMIFSEPVTPESRPGESYVDNFGRSLLGGYSSTYVADMALHGVAEVDRKKVQADLVMARQHSVLDEDIAEAVAIVADTDSWTVELLSSGQAGGTSERPQPVEVPWAECVHNLLESVEDICRLRMPSDFCLMHLEDKLQEVYFRSNALASYLDQNPRAGARELTGILGLEPSDLPLLLSVVSVHSPSVIRSVLRETYEKR